MKKNFSDLLSQPLPSKRNAAVVTESVDNDVDSFLDGDNTEEPVGDEGADGGDDSGSDEDYDFSEFDGELSDDESQHIDDVIKIAATPIMIQDVLGEEACHEFAESVDAQIAIDEAYTTEKTIVKMDKDSKKKRLFEIAVLAIAKEKNDPLFKKLDTAYKIERTIKVRLRNKYKAEANRRVQKYLQNARQSKSSAVASTAKKLSK